MDASSGNQREVVFARRRGRGAGLLRVLTGLGLAAAVSWPGTAGAAPPSQSLKDSAVGSGSAGVVTAFDFNVTSGPTGDNTTGVTTTDAFGIHFVGASIGCLAVSGNSATFAGTLEPNFFGFTTFKVSVVDNGPAGSGLDTYAAAAFNTPQDCSSDTTSFQAPLSSGDIVVTDAPPTSTDQCTAGGYARYGFSNEGLCIGYVLHARAGESSTVFAYTGAEQTFTVPGGVSSVSVTATGAAGGGPSSGTSLTAGRGAVVTGSVAVTPGQVLFVEVGGTGGIPSGGFNGGGDGATRNSLSVGGGGGASDVRLVSRASGGSLGSRQIVAAGGGGSAFPAAAGGDAGAAGGNSPGASTAGGGAGTQTAGGLGGCNPLNVGCGANGALGIGGVGGSWATPRRRVSAQAVAEACTAAVAAQATWMGASAAAAAARRSCRPAGRLP